MELVALAIIGLALLLVLSLGSSGGGVKGGATDIPSSKIYDVYSDIIQQTSADSVYTKARRETLRKTLAKLERELKATEDLRVAWENKRTDKTQVFDGFKTHGEAIAKHAGEAKALLDQLKG
jgi:hypothetical protein